MDSIKEEFNYMVHFGGPAPVDRLSRMILTIRSLPGSVATVSHCQTTSDGRRACGDLLRDIDQWADEILETLEEMKQRKEKRLLLGKSH